MKFREDFARRFKARELIISSKGCLFLNRPVFFIPHETLEVLFCCLTKRLGEEKIAQILYASAQQHAGVALEYYRRHHGIIPDDGGRFLCGQFATLGIGSLEILSSDLERHEVRCNWIHGSQGQFMGSYVKGLLTGTYERWFAHPGTLFVISEDDRTTEYEIIPAREKTEISFLNPHYRLNQLIISSPGTEMKPFSLPHFEEGQVLLGDCNCFFTNLSVWVTWYQETLMEDSESYDDFIEAGCHLGKRIFSSLRCSIRGDGEVWEELQEMTSRFGFGSPSIRQVSRQKVMVYLPRQFCYEISERLYPGNDNLYAEALLVGVFWELLQLRFQEKMTYEVNYRLDTCVICFTLI